MIELTSNELYAESARLIAEHLSLLRDRNFKFDPNTIEDFDATVELYRDLASDKLQIIGGNHEKHI